MFGFYYVLINKCFQTILTIDQVQWFYVIYQSPECSSKEYEIFYTNAASHKTSSVENCGTLRRAIHLLSDMLYQSSDKNVNLCDGYAYYSYRHWYIQKNKPNNVTSFPCPVLFARVLVFYCTDDKRFSIMVLLNM